MTIWYRVGVVVLAGLLLQACSRNVRDPGGVAIEDRPVGNTSDFSTGMGDQNYGATTSGVSLNSAGMDPMRLDDPNSLLSSRLFYFEFDSAEILPADQAALEAHGQYLALNPSIGVTLIGHADERGSREYNLALGERRARAVAQILSLQGGALSQMNLVSYGEEDPIATGHDESSWALNRRVELVYPGSN